MKLPKFTNRFFELSGVLEHCSKEQEKGAPPIFKTIERWMINQERSKLLNNDESFVQLQKLEDKIQQTLKKITNN